MESPRLRLAFVIPTLTVGGSERVMSLLLNYFAEKNTYDVHLVLLIESSLSFSLHPNVHVHMPIFGYNNHSRQWATLKTIQYLRRTIRSIQPESVLSFGDRYNAFVILALAGVRTRLLVSNRQSPNISNGWFIDFLNKRVYRYADCIIAQTQVAKEIFTRKYKTDKITVIGNPIGLPLNIVPESQRENIIINVGRFAEYKNQELLVKYLKETNMENWQIYFLGDGPRRAFVESQTSQLGMSEQVTFMGNVSDVDQFYSKSKVFAFTSTSEGFPNALAEAMAAGLTCISFDCVTGPSEMIEHLHNGVLIPVGDDDLYISQLKSLLLDMEKRRLYGENARKKMQSFSKDTVCGKFEELMVNGVNPSILIK
ncbi:MAG: glycosyltransferase [Saprospiraceae bacterium]|nr:glycosyltransferase [Saprospiraceae bacterium]